MNHSTPQAPDDPPIEAGHEPSEVGIRRIFLFGAALLVFTVVVMFVLRFVLSRFSVEEAGMTKNQPVLFQDNTGQFPSPNLQRHDAYDMAKYREQEEAALASYGWVDPEKRIAHIPITRALEIVAGRGLLKPKTTPVESSKK